ncbi:class I tRNA ligase family protein, partial [Akkermansiaceae bacterium]|nr:class I tRNA ligase family protein [Akkermansiaceae bacterium]
YCDTAESEQRKASVWVMGQLFDALVKLLAPVLAYTAEEAWEHAGREGSIHEQDFPKVNPKYATTGAIETIDKLLEIKAVMQAAIEEKVQGKEFKKNNEALVTLTVPSGNPYLELLQDHQFATEFFIVSALNIEEGDCLSAVVEATSNPMCPRCRKYEPPVNVDGLCQRCADAVS